MDSLVLLLLTLLALIPIVFLAGFAGCSYTSPVVEPPDSPSDPSDFAATPTGEHIRLTWKDNGSNTTHFRLKRRKGGAQIITVEVPAKAGTPPIDHEYLDSFALEPATAYEYELVAVAVYVESTGSVIAQAMTFP